MYVLKLLCMKSQNIPTAKLVQSSTFYQEALSLMNRHFAIQIRKQKHLQQTKVPELTPSTFPI